MKVIPHNKNATHINGRMNLSKEIPEDFMAMSSKLSPRFPNVMIDEISIAIGIANANREALAYHKNCPIVIKSSPFPTRSSMYFQSVCIISTKSDMKKVTINGPIKDFNMSLSNFFI